MNIFEKIQNFGSELSKVIELNDKINFYGTSKEIDSNHPYYIKFKDRLKSIYSDSVKANRFIHTYMNGEIPSAKVFQKIFQKLSVIWEAQNQSLSVILKDDTLNSTAEKKIRDTVLDYFKKEGFEEMIEYVTAYIVVLLEKDKKTGEVKPKIEFIDPKLILFVDTYENGIVSEIVYKTEKENILVYINETDYQLIDYSNKSIIAESIVQHQFSFTPACKFAPAKYIFENTPNEFFKYVYANVELFKREIADLNLDKIIPAQSGCGDEYTAEGHNVKCVGGKLYYFDGTDVSKPYTVENEMQYCKNCGEQIQIGVGSTHAIDYKNFKEITGLNPSDLISYIAPPIEITENQQREIPKKELEIISSICGVINQSNSQARNEVDVISDFQDRTHVLNSFGFSYQIPINTVIRLFLEFDYGKENIVSSNFWFGNKYYLLSREQLIEQKNTATNGIERSEAIEKLIVYDYQHDAEKKKLIEKLYSLYPYNSLTDEQFFLLIAQSLVSKENIELRTNFNFYVAELERKYANNLTMFDYDLMKSEIDKLVKENTNKIQTKIIE